ncbi:MAG: AAA family ATPase [Acidobacteriaceae bacterium]|nr:AAA family ATPase [Acidobacteriaceae bacterium]
MLLAELGDRICILGPSGSGKSTLACAIARKRGLTAIHLDQMHHESGSNWVPRPYAEFQQLHDEAITGERWVMDGNYSKLFPQRFARATGMILLDVSTATSLLRYVRRSLFERERAGALEGGFDSVKWNILHHILAVSPKNRRRYAAIYEQVSLPKLRLDSPRALAVCYREWGLER